MYKLNGDGGGKIGLGMTLKVMAGDKIDIFGKSYYETNNPGSTPQNFSIPILSMQERAAGGSW